MEKAEQRTHLKRLQGIVHMRGDEELPNVLAELREAIGLAHEEPVANGQENGHRNGEGRKRRGGRNRMEDGGQDREE